MDTVWEPGKVMKGKVGEPVNLGFISMATMTGFFGFCFCLMLGEFIWALVALTNHEPDRIAGLIILASFSLPFLMFCVLGIREMRHTPFRQYADRYGPPPGVYAYKKPAFIEVYYIPFRVQGEVWLWGDVVEHQDGYRAQYAYPKEIYGRPDLTEKYREAQR